MLSELVNSGGNQLSGLRFDLADRAEHLATARRSAISDAISKAQLYADAANVSVGEIISITESRGGGGPVVMMDTSVSQREGIPVMAGAISVDAHVEMVFAIAE